MRTKIIRNYQGPVGELSPDGTFHIRMHSSENWVSGHGWAIDSLTLYLAKEEVAKNVEIIDEDTRAVWVVALKALENEGYELTPYPDGIIYTFLSPEFWEVASLEGIQ